MKVDEDLLAAHQRAIAPVYPFHVRITSQVSQESRNRFVWLLDKGLQYVADYTFQRSGDVIIYSFKTEMQAFEFKLRWG